MTRSAPAGHWLAPTRRSQEWPLRYGLGAVVGAEVLALVFALIVLALGIGLPGGASFLIEEAAMLATLIPLYRAGRLGRRDLGLRTVSGARSVGLALLGLFAYAWFSKAWQLLVDPPTVAQRTFSGVGNASTLVIALTGLAATIGAPVVEEVFFRGLVFRCLRNRLSLIAACMIDGAIFGLLHFQYPLLARPELAFFGVVACLLYERTGSLLPGIALHSLIDATGFELALTGSAVICATAYGLLALVLLIRGAVRGLGARTKVQRRRAAGAGGAVSASVRAGMPAFVGAGSARGSAGVLPKPSRMPLLLACLTVALLGLVADRGGIFARGLGPGRSPAQSTAVASPRSSIYQGKPQVPVAGNWIGTGTTVETVGYGNDAPGRRLVRRLKIARGDAYGILTLSLARELAGGNLETTYLSPHGREWEAVFPARYYYCGESPSGKPIYWPQRTVMRFRFTAGGHSAVGTESNYSYTPECGYGRSTEVWTARHL